MKENIKRSIKIIHRISEGILFFFLILAVFDGVKDLISHEKDPFMYYLVGVSFLVYICFWQWDSVLGLWIHRNDAKNDAQNKEERRWNDIENEINQHYVDKSAENQLFKACKDLVITKGYATVALLQEKFKIGYVKASEIMERLEKENIIEAGVGAEFRRIKEE